MITLVLSRNQLILKNIRSSAFSINFQKKNILYEWELINYPGHVFEDIKRLGLGGKMKEGHVFLGRGNAPLNPSTIFRNFKEAGLDAGLGVDFTHKDLTTNKSENCE